MLSQSVVNQSPIDVVNDAIVLGGQLWRLFWLFKALDEVTVALENEWMDDVVDSGRWKMTEKPRRRNSWVHTYRQSYSHS